MDIQLLDHDGSSSSRRTLRACLQCHRKKIKCNGHRPICDICQTNGSECHYAQATKKRGPPKGYMIAIETRLQRLESLLGGLLAEGKVASDALDDLIYGLHAAARQEHGQAFYKQTSWASWTGSREAKLKPAAKTSNVTEHLHRARSVSQDGISDGSERLEDFRPWKRGRLASSETLCDRKAKLPAQMPDVLGQLSMDENRTLRYHGKASGLYMVAPSSTRFREYTWQFPKPTHWPRTTPSRLSSESELLESLGLAQAMPDKRVQKHLFDLYFACIHPMLPILDRTAFYEAWQHEDPARRPSITLLFSMWAFASKYSSWRSVQGKLGQFYTAGDAYYEAAKKCLDHDSENSRLSSVQAHLLLAMREQGTGRSTAAWAHSGAAVRIGQDLGLFRECSKWAIPKQQISKSERDLRNRVFWACSIVEKNVSAWIGRPIAIFDHDYDADFVEACQDGIERDEERDSWHPVPAAGLEPEPKDLIDALAAHEPSASTSSTETENKGSPITWYKEPDYVEPPDFVERKSSSSQIGCLLSSFRAQSQLSEIIGRIMQGIYSIRDEQDSTTQETILAMLDCQLTNWYTRLPNHLGYDLTATSNPPPPHILTLHMMYYVSLILLHRPFITSSGVGRVEPVIPSLQICISAANAIADIANTQSTVYRLRQCSPWFTYYIFTAAVIHVYVASTKRNVASHLTRKAKVSLAKCMLSLKEMELPWTSAVRSWEVLLGLVDLRDVSMSELTEMGQSIKTGATSVDPDGATALQLDRASAPETGHSTDVNGQGYPSDLECEVKSRTGLTFYEAMRLLRNSMTLRMDQSSGFQHVQSPIFGPRFIRDSVATARKLQRRFAIYGNTFEWYDQIPGPPKMSTIMNRDVKSDVAFLEGLDRHSDVFASRDYHLHDPNGSFDLPAPYEMFEPVGSGMYTHLQLPPAESLHGTDHGSEIYQEHDQHSGPSQLQPGVAALGASSSSRKRAIQGIGHQITGALTGSSDNAHADKQGRAARETAMNPATGLVLARGAIPPPILPSIHHLDGRPGEMLRPPPLNSPSSLPTPLSLPSSSPYYGSEQSTRPFLPLHSQYPRLRGYPSPSLPFTP